ncbi:MAG: response regulator [Bacteroidales bacterium]|nr:response regulator [Bacteroidales bacterium]
MEEKLRILFAEDLLTDFELAVNEIKNGGIEIEPIRVDTEEDFRRALRAFDPQIIISDYSMPVFDAEVALKISLEHNPYLPFIVLTGSINEETAVNCLKKGATDYVLKERIKRLPFAVREAMARWEMQMQREQYHTKLKESEYLLKQAQKIANIGSWEFDFTTRLVKASEQARQIYGVEPEIMPIDDMQAIPLKHYRPMLDNAMKEHIEQGKLYDVEFRIKRSNDGEIRYIHSLAEYNPQTNKLVGIITDITEKKINEQLKQEILLARESADFKRDFLAQMSHEIRTPLTAIEGIAELMQKTHLSDIQKDYMETLYFSLESLRNVTDEVLDFSKIEAGKIVINPVTFKPSEIAQKAEKFFQSVCKKPLKFCTEGFEELPELIHADKQRVMQIITNLLSNAVKYSGKGTVKLKARPEKNLGNGEMLIRIEVEDEGPGIHHELMKSLFKPFSQIHIPDEEMKMQGTGLGLSICKELSVLLGGEAGVESEPGKGSSFWFTFLAEIKDSQDASYEREELQVTENTHTLKILLAEDKEINKKVISLMLQSIGHEVVTVSNGKEAFEICTQQKFDLVLMDVQMPVMDGIEATKLIKSKCPDPPPVIGLSANALDEDRKKYTRAGMDDYISKPFKTNDIVKLIEKLKL